MLHPLQADALVPFAFRKLIQIGHKDDQSSFWSHVRVPVHQLVLIVVEIQVEPRVIGEIHHREVHVAHGQFSKIDRAIA